MTLWKVPNSRDGDADPESGAYGRRRKRERIKQPIVDLLFQQREPRFKTCMIVAEIIENVGISAVGGTEPFGRVIDFFVYSMKLQGPLHALFGLLGEHGILESLKVNEVSFHFGDCEPPCPFRAIPTLV
jgi:hypothetical protein